MLRSLEIKNAIRDLKTEIEDGIRNQIDMTSKAEELDSMISEYQSAIELETKIKNKTNKESKKLETRKSFNRALKALLAGRQVAEADKQYMPQIVDAAGQYISKDNGAAGAYLVSEEYLPLEKINRGVVDLATLCRKVYVTKTSGKVPVLDMSQPDVELVDFNVDNETEIEKKSAVFQQVPYTCKNRGAIIPIGLDLVEDADCDVVEAVYDLFNEARIRSRNKSIISAAQKGPQEITSDLTSIATFDAIKTALNVNLKVADKANATILMDQTAFNNLSTVKDGNDQYLMQPVVTDPGKYAIDGRPVVVVDNTYTMPGIIVGNFNHILDIERKGLEISSDMSSGFKTYSMNVRAVVRNTLLNINKTAFVVIKSA